MVTEVFTAAQSRHLTGRDARTSSNRAVASSDKAAKPAVSRRGEVETRGASSGHLIIRTAESSASPLPRRM
jgi:hypothetical protein